jgi:methylenetetrahydrofolate dehydrogenase (NADP+)/methenyltetrahydrofolate cyclohydrolase
LLRTIENLNADASVHGILVQMPLPRRLDAAAILRTVSPLKDVDGLHPLNVGLSGQGAPDAVQSCTPRGCMELLRR